MMKRKSAVEAAVRLLEPGFDAFKSAMLELRIAGATTPELRDHLDGLEARMRKTTDPDVLAACMERLREAILPPRL